MGQSVRIAILEESPSQMRVHYDKFYFYCLPKGCPACRAGSRAVDRYLIWVYLYETDDKGAVRMPFTGSIKGWQFGRDKFAALTALFAEWGDLRKLDLTLTCSDEKFQRMSISPARECVWLRDPEKAKEVIDLFQAEKMDEILLMARTLTADEIILEMSNAPESAPSRAQPAGPAQPDSYAGSGYATPREQAHPAGPAELSALLDQLDVLPK
jgi:hypothetical protein